jgi:hypothetical protein
MPEYVTERGLAELTGIPAKSWQALRYTGEGPPFIKIKAGSAIAWQLSGSGSPPASSTAPLVGEIRPSAPGSDLRCPSWAA